MCEFEKRWCYWFTFLFSFFFQFHKSDMITQRSNKSMRYHYSWNRNRMSLSQEVIGVGSGAVGENETVWFNNRNILFFKGKSKLMSSNVLCLFPCHASTALEAWQGPNIKVAKLKSLFIHYKIRPGWHNANKPYRIWLVMCSVRHELTIWIHGPAYDCFLNHQSHSILGHFMDPTQQVLPVRIFCFFLILWEALTLVLWPWAMCGLFLLASQCSSFQYFPCWHLPPCCGSVLTCCCSI